MAEQSDGPVVEVAYGTPARQAVVTIDWQAGLTAREAVGRSGLLEAFPEIDPATLVLGVFGEQVAPAHRLEPGDRVEICRPLIQDPRDMRRAALSAGSVMGRQKE